VPIYAVLLPIALLILGCVSRPTKPQVRTLADAVTADDVPAAQRLLAAGADANQQDPWGESLLVLSVAVDSRGTAMTELLLAHGANVNFRSAAGGTPLIAAVMSGREDIVRSLIAHGANIEQRNGRLQTPLMVGLQYPHITDLLLKAGADVRARDQSGYTALTYCSDMPTVSELVARGADVNAEDAEHRTLLPEVAAAGQVEELKFLAAHGARFEREGTAAQLLLYHSLSCGDDRSLRALVELGVDIDATDSKGNTGLFSAPTPTIARWLIDAGADLHRRNRDGYTAREWAAETGRFAVADFLERYERGLEHAACPPLARTPRGSSTRPS